MRLLRLGLAVAALVCLARPARANWNLAVGLKWEPASYTTPVSAGPVSPTAASTQPLSGFNATNLNNYVGAFILDGRLGFTLGLELAYVDHTLPISPSMSTDENFVQFGVAFGAKYYLLKPRANRVAPYVWFDFFKYVASVSTSSNMIPKAQTDLLSGLESPLGIDAAVGVEYFFTHAFSLGAELLGLRYAYASGTTTTTGGFSTTSLTTTNQYVSFYTGVTLNYRFEIGRNWKVREPGETEAPGEEPRAAPRAHKTTLEPDHAPPTENQPPPREAPPSETESVD